MTNAYALKVHGNSMHPAIRDGWIVMVEPNSEPQVGEFAVVQCANGRKMVKEFLGWRGNELILQSVNEDHGRLTLHRSEVKAIHAVGGIHPPSRRRGAVRKMPVIVPWRLPRWRHMRNRNQM